MQAHDGDGSEDRRGPGLHRECVVDGVRGQVRPGLGVDLRVGVTPVGEGTHERRFGGLVSLLVEPGAGGHRALDGEARCRGDGPGQRIEAIDLHLPV